MKRYMTFILLIFITVGTWASGASEQNTSRSYRFYTEKITLDNEGEVKSSESDGVQVYPSSSVIGIINDYIYDEFDDDDNNLPKLHKTDNIYNEIEEYLSGDKDSSQLQRFVSPYVHDVVTDNTDDILYYINDELLAGLKENSADASFMVLGNIKIKAVIDFVN